MSERPEPHTEISVVIPVYGRDLPLDVLYSRLATSLSTITAQFEILLINDQSAGIEWNLIEELARKDARVKGICLSRNFGQHRAIAAGLDFACGDWVVVMAADLQERPEDILKFYNKARQGYDVVVGRRINRQDNWWVKTNSRLFYFLFNRVSACPLNSRTGNFGLYAAKVIRAVKSMKAPVPVFAIQVKWVGFRRIEIDIEHDCRAKGTSGYTFLKRLRLAVDLFLMYASAPFTLLIAAGSTLFLSGILLLPVLSQNGRLWQTLHQDWWTHGLMLTMIIATGIMTVSIGILGSYIDRMIRTAQKEPTYLIDKTTFDLLKE